MDEMEEDWKRTLFLADNGLMLAFFSDAYLARLQAWVYIGRLVRGSDCTTLAHTVGGQASICAARRDGRRVSCFLTETRRAFRSGVATGGRNSDIRVFFRPLVGGVFPSGSLPMGHISVLRC